MYLKNLRTSLSFFFSVLRLWHELVVDDINWYRSGTANRILEAKEKQREKEKEKTDRATKRAKRYVLLCNLSHSILCSAALSAALINGR